VASQNEPIFSRYPLAVREPDLNVTRLALEAAIGLFPSPPAAHASTVVSFETPVVNGGYEYSSNSPYAGPNGNFSNPTAEGVTFTGMSGIQANGSAWGFTNAPDGNQTAFLQTQSFFPSNPGSLSFSLPTVANQSYDLTFEVESRPSTGGNSFTVNAGTNSQSFAAPSTTSWITDSVLFTALGGSTNFAISINIPSVVTDQSIGVDAIGLTPTPLPATWMMMIAGMVGLGFLAFRATKRDAVGAVAA
jgi:hypothetical protein